MTNYFCVWGETLLQWSLAVISFFSSLPGERFTPMWCHVIISWRWLACAFVWFGLVVWLSWLTKLADTLTGKLSANKLDKTRGTDEDKRCMICLDCVYHACFFVYCLFTNISSMDVLCFLLIIIAWLQLWTYRSAFRSMQCWPFKKNMRTLQPYVRGYTFNLCSSCDSCKLVWTLLTAVYCSITLVLMNRGRGTLFISV